MATELDTGPDDGSNVRFVFSFEVRPDFQVDVFIMPAAEYQQLRDGGDLSGASREERLPYIRENAVSDLTFIGRSSGRGQTEISPGTYWLDLRRVDTEAEGSFTFDYSYQVYSADTDE